MRHGKASFQAVTITSRKPSSCIHRPDWLGCTHTALYLPRRADAHLNPSLPFNRPSVASSAQSRSDGQQGLKQLKCTSALATGDEVGPKHLAWRYRRHDPADGDGGAIARHCDLPEGHADHQLGQPTPNPLPHRRFGRQPRAGELERATDSGNVGVDCDGDDWAEVFLRAVRPTDQVVAADRDSVAQRGRRRRGLRAALLQLAALEPGQSACPATSGTA
ncbi:unnamed protein product [Protopolystoma xenopodis]|uniref:Uncharacterized protein n=1 Tax=Protopolystoma xenopodis TaxID=117903 RepID=A0A448XJA2_9PLAT|nr:unnamed protein product [Protopolystoma xenopodis]